MRILLVEDEPSAARMLAKGLREQSYAVDIATDGEAALYQLSIYDYDLVILDVMLPHKDGLQVSREMRSLGLSTPVLMAFYYILRALNLPSGSEIIFPALTFWVVPEIARQAGFKPVFVDVDPFSFNLEPKHIAAAITEHTRVIVPTHLYGQPCAMKEILRIAEKHNLIVVEDCAQAAGARYHGRLVGTFGTAAFFSFQMLKGVNTYGGGMMCRVIE